MRAVEARRETGGRPLYVLHEFSWLLLGASEEMSPEYSRSDAHDDEGQKEKYDGGSRIGTVMKTRT